VYWDQFYSYIALVLDVLAAGFGQWKGLVSRKCNTNLFHLAAVWKHTVLAHQPQDKMSMDNMDAWVK